MRARKLRLAKETLSVLDAGDLRSVAGGTGIHCVFECNYTYCPECLNDISFEFCPTLPIEQCV